MMHFLNKRFLCSHAKTILVMPILLLSSVAPAEHIQGQALDVSVDFTSFEQPLFFLPTS